jgi:hypothetical protein
MTELTAGILSARSEEFYLKEFESLRHEIEMVEQDQRSLERNAVVAVAIAWGWLWSTNRTPPEWAYVVPCLLSALCWLRAKGVSQVYGVFTSYLVVVEDSFWKTGAPKGWHHHIMKTGTSFAKGANLFWILLNAATFAVAILRLFNRLQ